MEKLYLVFDGSAQDRHIFLKEIRLAVMLFTGQSMQLDALINEMVKNIYDHAGGLGSLEIIRHKNSFEFTVKDDGDKSYDFELCKQKSTAKDSSINMGIGLRLIVDLAKNLRINLKIDTSKGFTYSGTYTPRT